jgi:hypothetical protein
VGNLSPGWSGDRADGPIRAVIVFLAAAFFVLLGYTTFLGYPTITQTGDANLQTWLGPEAAPGCLLLVR